MGWCNYSILHPGSGTFVHSRVPGLQQTQEAAGDASDLTRCKAGEYIRQAQGVPHIP